MCMCVTGGKAFVVQLWRDSNTNAGETNRREFESLTS